MTLLQRIFQYLQRNTSWFCVLLLPYYFTRFVFSSLKHRSTCFFRYPMGHYGSPIPGKAELLQREDELFDATVETVPGIDLNVEAQLELLHQLSNYNRAFPVNQDATGKARYYSDNATFRSSDALVLYCMLCYFRPREVIEIGSGFSSALMLDVRDTVLQDINLTFIEPYPATLDNLLYDTDRDKCLVIQKKIQNVNLGIFDNLDEGCILFIDSSHVLKIGSDLSTVFFSILPRLKPGVLVHIHDIYWPFEYPKHMLYEGRAWNEAYFVRSFLQFNDSFEILLFPSYLQKRHSSVLTDCLKSYNEHSGSSLWLKKVRG